MKLKQFLQDSIPMGKGAVKIPIKGVIEQYKDRYEILTKDTSKKFSHTVYKTSPGGRVLVHVKVPSETVSNFYYDILIELITTVGNFKLEECDIRIFSNCPSFVYTYAYVFYHLDAEGTNTSKDKTGLLIKGLQSKIPKDRLLVPGSEKKLSDEVLDNEPVVRNPGNLPLFDKSIYYAIFYLQDTTSLKEILSTRKNVTERQIFANVADFDSLMLKRAQQERKDREKARRTRTTEPALKVKPKQSKVASAVNMVKALKPISAKKPTSPTKPKSSRK